jgi:hypothetical protein
MPPERFEPAIPAIELSQIYALEPTDTGTNFKLAR